MRQRKSCSCLVGVGCLKLKAWQPTLRIDPEHDMLNDAVLAGWRQFGKRHDRPYLVSTDTRAKDQCRRCLRRSFLNQSKCSVEQEQTDDD